MTNINDTTNHTSSRQNIIRFPVVAGGNGHAVSHYNGDYCRPLMPGDRVMITGGPSDGQQGTIIQTGLTLNEERTYSVQLADRTVMARAGRLERI